MLVGTCSDSKTDVTEEWQRKLLQLCALFERVESNIILAVSLQRKVGNAPRLLAALVNHHLEPHKEPVAKVLVEKMSASNRWKVGSQNQILLRNMSCMWDIVHLCRRQFCSTLINNLKMR